MRRSRLVLSEAELERYDRQMMIAGWGVSGQERLKSATAVVLGVGGLGSPVSLYLAAAGIGHLVLVDQERFEMSNLNRQVLGWQRGLGRLKVVAAAEKLRSLNPHVEVEVVPEKLWERNIDRLIEGADIVIDALDNWETRFIVNRACVHLQIPFIHAGIRGWYGQIMTIKPGEGPCLRCLLPRRPPDASRPPVLGATPGLFAMLQVMEAFKLLLGLGECLVGRVLVFDGLDMSFTSVEVRRNPDCPICGFHA